MKKYTFWKFDGTNVKENNKKNEKHFKAHWGGEGEKKKLFEETIAQKSERELDASGKVK